MYSILIVEDDLATSTFIKRIIARYKDYQIKYAANGLEAMKILESETIDGVISDIHMPVVSGFEVLEFIRENPKLETLPVMMMSSLNTRDDIEKAFKLKIYDYILKPLNMQETIIRIERFFKQIEKESNKRKDPVTGVVKKIVAVISVNKVAFEKILKEVVDEYTFHYFESTSKGLEYCLNSIVDIAVIDEELGGMNQNLIARMLKKHNKETLELHEKSGIRIIGIGSQKSRYFDALLSKKEELIEEFKII